MISGKYTERCSYHYNPVWNMSVIPPQILLSPLKPPALGNNWFSFCFDSLAFSECQVIELYSTVFNLLSLTSFIQPNIFAVHTFAAYLGSLFLFFCRIVLLYGFYIEVGKF